MKYVLTVVFCFVLITGVCTAAEKHAIESQKDKESYSVGYQVGTSLRGDGMEIDFDLLIDGIWDAVDGKEPKVGAEEMKKLLADLRKRSRDAQARKIQEQSFKNLTDAVKFLEENEKKEGIKTTESGLQYKVVREGDGPKPKMNDTVTVHYRGTFMNGKEFDSSYARSKPETFQVGGVIKGWTEALQMMKVGSKWELFVPPDLAYGKAGQGQRIPSNSLLIFDIELLSTQQTKEEPDIVDEDDNAAPQTKDQEAKK